MMVFAEVELAFARCASAVDGLYLNGGLALWARRAYCSWWLPRGCGDQYRCFKFSPRTPWLGAPGFNF